VVLPIRGRVQMRWCAYAYAVAAERDDRPLMTETATTVAAALYAVGVVMLFGVRSWQQKIATGLPVPVAVRTGVRLTVKLPCQPR
jgi:hypothetical protein